MTIDEPHQRDPHAPFRGTGLVSLLSDFGLLDPYVGVMHGVLHACGQGLRVVDLCHGVEPQNTLQGGWYLATSFAYFPPGTVHVAVVDPGVGSERRILAAAWRGHAFLAPDNGLLGYVLGKQAVVHALDVQRFALPDPSRTFHGRDVFAPAAAALAGGLDLQQVGPRVEDWRRDGLPEPDVAADGSVTTQVLYADRFGNLITPLGAERLGETSGWRLEVEGRVMPLVSTYADVAPGEALGLIGSSGTVEVSVRDGSASSTLELAAGAEVRLRKETRQ